MSYNGWANYETWRINLEVFSESNLGASDFGYNSKDDAYALSHALEQYAEDVILEQSKGLAVEYARAFLSEVNWYEIAENMVSDLEEAA